MGIDSPWPWNYIRQMANAGNAFPKFILVMKKYLQKVLIFFVVHKTSNICD